MGKFSNEWIRCVFFFCSVSLKHIEWWRRDMSDVGRKKMFFWVCHCTDFFHFLCHQGATGRRVRKRLIACGYSRLPPDGRRLYPKVKRLVSHWSNVNIRVPEGWDAHNVAATISSLSLRQVWLGGLVHELCAPVGLYMCFLFLVGRWQYVHGSWVRNIVSLSFSPPRQGDRGEKVSRAQGQPWSISNFRCSLARNITSHSTKNLAFHTLLRWKMVILAILTTSLIHLSSKGWENVLFELGSAMVNRSKCFSVRIKALCFENVLVMTRG